jgi:hypothetical protein
MEVSCCRQKVFADAERRSLKQEPGLGDTSRPHCVLTPACSASTILVVLRFRRAALARFPMRKLAFLFCSLFLALPAAAQSVDEILAKYFLARGGMDRIKSVQSERVTGTISFGPGEEGPFLVERARPLKMHMEFNLNGQVLIRTYDGKSAGWIYNAFMPNPAVQPMTEADLRNIVDEADFDGPFVDYKSKGNQIEFAGKEDLEGKPAYKLKLTNHNGEVNSFFFDASTYILLKCQGSRQFNGKDIPWVTFFRDYRVVDGLKYPFLIEYEEPGTENGHKITSDKIELNVPIDGARFSKPNPPPAPSAPPAEAPPGDSPKPN